MAWLIILHWAEMALFFDLRRMFHSCNSFADVFGVLDDADGLERLGIITGLTIASRGFTGLGRTVAKELRLVELAGRLWEWLSRAWK